MFTADDPDHPGHGKVDHRVQQEVARFPVSLSEGSAEHPEELQQRGHDDQDCQEV